jgi:hypothetical protein
VAKTPKPNTIINTDGEGTRLAPPALRNLTRSLSVYLLGREIGANVGLSVGRGIGAGIGAGVGLGGGAA